MYTNSAANTILVGPQAEHHALCRIIWKTTAVIGATFGNAPMTAGAALYKSHKSTSKAESIFKSR